MRDFFLTSARLAFGNWTTADLPLATAIWGDPKVTRLNSAPFTAAQISERMAFEMSNLASFRIQYWPIFLRASGEHVGCCGLQPRDAAGPIYELGYLLRPVHWGQGLAGEAARAVVDYAFGTLGAAGLFAGHHRENLASQRVLQRLGFRYTHDEFYPPLQHDEPCYLLRRDDAQRA